MVTRTVAEPSAQESAPMFRAAEPTRVGAARTPGALLASRHTGVAGGAASPAPRAS